MNRTSRSIPAIPIADKKRADRGRNEGDEKRDEDDDADRAAGVIRKARNGRDREDEDQRQTGEKNIERDFVRRFLPLRAFDKRDHPVEKGRALRRGDADLDPVGENPGAAGNGGTIAAALADDGRGFAGDRQFVDRGDAFDHVAVAGNKIAGLDKNDFPGFQIDRGHAFDDVLHAAPTIRIDEPFRPRVGARLAQGRGLRLAAAFGDSFREIRKKQGDPEPKARSET